MERYHQLDRLYEEFDAATLRAHQDFVGVFPPVDSRVALEYWRDASDDLAARKAAIREAFPGVGDAFAEVAAHVDRDGAFTALDLLQKYDRPANVLVLDVDETLRSAGRTDNEIPRETLWLLRELHDEGLPVVICTGQTLENVKGFLIQGLGTELVFSGDLSVVYEGGSGVFTPGHGEATKRLLYEELDPDVRAVFDAVRARVLTDAPERIRRQCHLQGNEFNVTLKPNYETGSDRARTVVAAALAYLLDLLGGAVASVVDDPAVLEGSNGADGTAADEADGDRPSSGRAAGDDPPSAGRGVDPGAWARAFYADVDPEIQSALASEDATSDVPVDAVPADARAVFERVDVAYYEGDAAEVTSRELDKPRGVEAALDVLGVDDPFAFVMGDSKSDLRVMRWAAERDAGIAAAPEHASEAVLEHVRGTDGLVFARGDAAEPLRTAFALHCLAGIE